MSQWNREQIKKATPEERRAEARRAILWTLLWGAVTAAACYSLYLQVGQ